MPQQASSSSPKLCITHRTLLLSTDDRMEDARGMWDSASSCHSLRAPLASRTPAIGALLLGFAGVALLPKRCAGSPLHTGSWALALAWCMC